MRTPFFDDYSEAEIYYSPAADRMFIFHRATFLEMPCLEREDGHKLIMKSPEDAREMCKLPNEHRYKLKYIGKL